MCLEIISLIYKKDLALFTYNGRYVIKPNQTESNSMQMLKKALHLLICKVVGWLVGFMAYQLLLVI